MVKLCQIAQYDDQTDDFQVFSTYPINNNATVRLLNSNVHSIGKGIHQFSMGSDVMHVQLGEDKQWAFICVVDSLKSQHVGKETIQKMMMSFNQNNDLESICETIYLDYKFSEQGNEKINVVKKKIKETKDSVLENIDLALDNRNRADILDEQTSHLQNSAQRYRKSAQRLFMKQLVSVCLLLGISLFIIFIIVALIVIIWIIILVAVSSGDSKKE